MCAARVSLSLDHGHEVSDFRDTGVREEASEQDIGIRQVELPGMQMLNFGPDAKEAAALGIEESSKNRWRIKVRKAEEVDAPIDADQCDGTHVADDAVVLDGLETAGTSHVGHTQ